MPGLLRCACACVPLCCLGWLGEALRLTGGVDARGASAKPRVALILRGEAFRGGGSSHHLIAKPEYITTQRDNYASQLANVILPFEKAGYGVDVFTAMYSTPYDHIIKQTFGRRLKLFEPLRFKSSNQATNAAHNLEAFQSYANRTGREYRFVVFARHDTRFLEDVGRKILQHRRPDDTVFLFRKREFQTVPKGSPQDRCVNQRRWNVRNRQSISWFCSDLFQVVPQQFVGAFGRLLNGTTLLGDATKPHEPRWPGECWAELGPLIGGDRHIDFFQEGALKLCKTSAEHSLQRAAELRSLPGLESDGFSRAGVEHRMRGVSALHQNLHVEGAADESEEDLPWDGAHWNRDVTCEEGVR